MGVFVSDKCSLPPSPATLFLHLPAFKTQLLAISHLAHYSITISLGIYFYNSPARCWRWIPFNTWAKLRQSGCVLHKPPTHYEKISLKIFSCCRFSKFFDSKRIHPIQKSFIWCLRKSNLPTLSVWSICLGLSPNRDATETLLQGGPFFLISILHVIGCSTHTQCKDLSLTEAD